MILLQETINNFQDNTFQYSLNVHIKSTYSEVFLTSDSNYIKINNAEYTPCINLPEIKYSKEKFLVQIINNANIIQDIIQISQHKNNVQIGLLINNIHEIIFSGVICKLEKNQNLLNLEISNNLFKLTNSIGEFFSMNCRAEFGDDKCQVNLQNYTFSGEIINIINESEFVCNISKPDSFFFNGYAEIISKTGTLFKSKILQYTNGRIKLLANIPFADIVNCDVKLIQPCDKTLEVCKKFNNVINFRGEPFLSP